MRCQRIAQIPNKKKWKNANERHIITIWIVENRSFSRICVLKFCVRADLSVEHVRIAEPVVI